MTYERHLLHYTSYTSLSLLSLKVVQGCLQRNIGMGVAVYIMFGEGFWVIFIIII